eukprot:Seg4277.2 transcript_id=Seg4277.2/GoldUCD/mRNA.D3Y31 product="putative protein RAB5IF" protein_id=Seg4277.2/GoldUCD/D3Y31
MKMCRASNKKNGKAVAGEITKDLNSIFKRALTAGSTWDDKDEFLDVIYWMRQIVALVNGLLFGFIPIVGLLGLILFVLVNCAAVFFYSSKYQQIDEDEYGGPLEILKEGLFTAFAVFLVSWITIYTAIQ